MDYVALPKIEVRNYTTYEMSPFFQALGTFLGVQSPPRVHFPYFLPQVAD